MQVATTIETDTGEMIVKRVSVPIGLEELMEGLTKEVILKKPKDIYVFASQYFAHLLDLRDKGALKGIPIKRAQSVNKTIPKEKFLNKKSKSVDPSKQLARQNNVRASSPVKKALSVTKIVPPLRDSKNDRTKAFLDKRKARKASTGSVEKTDKKPISKRETSLSSSRKSKVDTPKTKEGKNETKKSAGSPKKSSKSTPRKIAPITSIAQKEAQIEEIKPVEEAGETKIAAEEGEAQKEDLETGKDKVSAGVEDEKKFEEVSTENHHAGAAQEDEAQKEDQGVEETKNKDLESVVIAEENEAQIPENKSENETVKEHAIEVEEAKIVNLEPSVEDQSSISEEGKAQVPQNKSENEAVKEHTVEVEEAKIVNVEPSVEDQSSISEEGKAQIPENKSENETVKEHAVEVEEAKIVKLEPSVEDQSSISAEGKAQITENKSENEAVKEQAVKVEMDVEPSIKNQPSISEEGEAQKEDSKSDNKIVVDHSSEVDEAKTTDAKNQSSVTEEVGAQKEGAHISESKSEDETVKDHPVESTEAKTSGLGSAVKSQSSIAEELKGEVVRDSEIASKIEDELLDSEISSENAAIKRGSSGIIRAEEEEDDDEIEITPPEQALRDNEKDSKNSNEVNLVAEAEEKVVTQPDQAQLKLEDDIEKEKKMEDLEPNSEAKSLIPASKEESSKVNGDNAETGVEEISENKDKVALEVEDLTEEDKSKSSVNNDKDPKSQVEVISSPDHLAAKAEDSVCVGCELKENGASNLSSPSQKLIEKESAGSEISQSISPKDKEEITVTEEKIQKRSVTPLKSENESPKNDIKDNSQEMTENVASVDEVDYQKPDENLIKPSISLDSLDEITKSDEPPKDTDVTNKLDTALTPSTIVENTEPASLQNIPENQQLRHKRSISEQENEQNENIQQTGFDVAKLREEIKQVEEIQKTSNFKSSYNPYLLRQEIKNASQDSNDENKFSEMASKVAAALKIQTLWRGFRVRKDMKREKLTAVSPSEGIANQQNERKDDEKAQGGDGIEMLFAVIKIQSLWRGFKARRHLVNPEIKSDDAKKIESSEKTKEGDAKMDLLVAVIRIQSLWRGYKARKNKPTRSIEEIKRDESAETDSKSLEVKNDLDNKETREMDIAKAVVRIQSLWRGFNIRRLKKRGELFGKAVEAFSGDKEILRDGRQLDKTKANRSAQKIQAIWRGYKVRKSIRDVNNKLAELQKPSECDEMPGQRGPTDEDILNAATKIQAGVRGYMVRKSMGKSPKQLKSITEEEPPQTKFNDQQIIEAIKLLEEIPTHVPETSNGRVKRSTTLQEPIKRQLIRTFSVDNGDSKPNLESIKNNSLEELEAQIIPENETINIIEKAGTPSLEAIHELDETDIVNSNLKEVGISSSKAAMETPPPSPQIVNETEKQEAKISVERPMSISSVSSSMLGYETTPTRPVTSDIIQEQAVDKQNENKNNEVAKNNESDERNEVERGSLSSAPSTDSVVTVIYEEHADIPNKDGNCENAKFDISKLHAELSETASLTDRKDSESESRSSSKTDGAIEEKDLETSLSKDSAKNGNEGKKTRVRFSSDSTESVGKESERLSSNDQEEDQKSDAEVAPERYSGGASSSEKQDQNLTLDMNKTLKETQPKIVAKEEEAIGEPKNDESLKTDQETQKETDAIKDESEKRENHNLVVSDSNQINEEISKELSKLNEKSISEDDAMKNDPNQSEELQNEDSVESKMMAPEGFDGEVSDLKDSNNSEISTEDKNIENKITKSEDQPEETLKESNKSDVQSQSTEEEPNHEKDTLNEPNAANIRENASEISISEVKIEQLPSDNEDRSKRSNSAETKINESEAEEERKDTDEGILINLNRDDNVDKTVDLQKTENEIADPAENQNRNESGESKIEPADSERFLIQKDEHLDQSQIISKESDPSVSAITTAEEQKVESNENKLLNDKMKDSEISNEDQKDNLEKIKPTESTNIESISKEDDLQADEPKIEKMQSDPLLAQHNQSEEPIQKNEDSDSPQVKINLPETTQVVSSNISEQNFKIPESKHDQGETLDHITPIVNLVHSGELHDLTTAELKFDEPKIEEVQPEPFLSQNDQSKELSQTTEDSDSLPVEMNRSETATIEMSKISESENDPEKISGPNTSTASHVQNEVLHDEGKQQSKISKVSDSPQANILEANLPEVAPTDVSKEGIKIAESKDNSEEKKDSNQVLKDDEMVEAVQDKSAKEQNLKGHELKADKNENKEQVEKSEDSSFPQSKSENSMPASKEEMKDDDKKLSDSIAKEVPKEHLDISKNDGHSGNESVSKEAELKPDETKSEKPQSEPSQTSQDSSQLKSSNETLGNEQEELKSDNQKLQDDNTQTDQKVELNQLETDRPKSTNEEVQNNNAEVSGSGKNNFFPTSKSDPAQDGHGKERDSEVETENISSGPGETQTEETDLSSQKEESPQENDALDNKFSLENLRREIEQVSVEETDNDIPKSDSPHNRLNIPLLEKEIKENEEKMKSLGSDEQEIDEHIEAATKIQSNYRGYRVRRSLETSNFRAVEQDEHQENSSLTVTDNNNSAVNKTHEVSDHESQLKSAINQLPDRKLPSDEPKQTDNTEVSKINHANGEDSKQITEIAKDNNLSIDEKSETVQNEVELSSNEPESKVNVNIIKDNNSIEESPTAGRETEKNVDSVESVKPAGKNVIDTSKNTTDSAEENSKIENKALKHENITITQQKQDGNIQQEVGPTNDAEENLKKDNAPPENNATNKLNNTLQNDHEAEIDKEKKVIGDSSKIASVQDKTDVMSKSESNEVKESDVSKEEVVPKVHPSIGTIPQITISEEQDEPDEDENQTILEPESHAIEETESVTLPAGATSTSESVETLKSEDLIENQKQESDTVESAQPKTLEATETSPSPHIQSEIKAETAKNEDQDLSIKSKSTDSETSLITSADITEENSKVSELKDDSEKTAETVNLIHSGELHDLITVSPTKSSSIHQTTSPPPSSSPPPPALVGTSELHDSMIPVALQRNEAPPGQVFVIIVSGFHKNSSHALNSSLKNLLNPLIFLTFLYLEFRE